MDQELLRHRTSYTPPATSRSASHLWLPTHGGGPTSQASALCKANIASVSVSGGSKFRSCPIRTVVGGRRRTGSTVPRPQIWVRDLGAHLYVFQACSREKTSFRTELRNRDKYDCFLKWNGVQSKISGTLLSKFGQNFNYFFLFPSPPGLL